LVAIALFFLYSSLGGIITTAFEKFGSKIIQTSLTLKETWISATDGKGALHDFRVTNPSGFKTECSVEFDEINMPWTSKLLPKTP
jgi:hypothetical protein